MRRYLAGLLGSARTFLPALRDARRVEETLGKVEGPDRFFEMPDDKGFQAPRRLAVDSPTYFTSEPYLRQMHRADWQNTHRAIQEFAARFVLEMRRQGIPVFVHCAFRTPEEQERLKREGRSKALHPNAPHVRGGAVDIVHSRYAWELTRQEWDYLGKVGKDIAQKMGIRIEWGGDWRFYDPAHWELENWRICTSAAEPRVGPPLRMTPHRIKGSGWSFVKGVSRSKQSSSQHV